MGVVKRLAKSQKVRNFGYRLGLRRRLDKEDVCAGLICIVGCVCIVAYWVVCGVRRPLLCCGWCASVGVRSGDGS